MEPIAEEVKVDNVEVNTAVAVEPEKEPKAKKRRDRGDSIRGLSSPAMHRIKRAACVDRLGVMAVDATRSIAHDFMKKILTDSVTIAKHHKRKTIRVEDIQEALEMQPQCCIAPKH